MSSASSPVPSTGDISRRLPNFRIERQLAHGNMGVVYLAEEMTLHRKVALKILSPALADQDPFRQRFARESALAANLDHPNIVPIYSAGDSQGLLYLAMRYVDGPDLGALLGSEGPFDLDRTVTIIRQIAAALDAAHAAELVHRDVKPGNILFDQGSDHVYLCDFGIAKQASSSSTLTSTGQFLGTLDYVAPEQIQGKPLDGRADQYALACVVYHCLTGVPPYRREETTATIWAHLSEQPPRVTDQRPDLPAAVNAVVVKGLAKEPKDRYGSCLELAAALRDVYESGRRALAPDGAPFTTEMPRLTPPAAAPPAPAPPAPAPPAEPTAEVPIVRPAAPTPAEPAPAAFTPAVVAPPPHAPGAAPALPAPGEGQSLAPIPHRPAEAPSPPPRWPAARILKVLVAPVLGILVAAGGIFLAGRGPGQPADDAPPVNPAEAALLARVPAALRDTCRAVAASTSGAQHAFACTHDGDAEQAAVALMGSQPALEQAYRQAVEAAGVATGSGDCASATDAEHVYPGVGEVAGRAVCVSRSGEAKMVWRDDQDLTLLSLTRADGDHRLLYASWVQIAGVPAFPTPFEGALADAVRELDCHRAPASTLDVFPGAIAAIECTPITPLAATARYYGFADLTAMRQVYEQRVTATGTPRNVNCDPRTVNQGFEGEREWRSQKVVVGRVLCYTNGTERFMEWTFEPALLIGQGIGGDPAALTKWWDDDSSAPPPSRRTAEPELSA